MKIAVLSDIHGNFTALEAVYHDLKQRKIDYLVILGDMICDFPRPEDTLNLINTMISEYPATIVRGNKEEYMLKEHSHWSYCSKNGSLLHSYQHLRKQDLLFLKSLPVSCVIQPDYGAALTITHGHVASFNHQDLNSFETPVLLFGHTHFRYVLEKENKLILNPGSVGMSGIDTRISEYAILEWQEDRYAYEMIDVKYDVEKEKRRIIDSGFINESKYWGAAVFRSLETGKVATIPLIHLATQLADGKRPEEVHFKKAAQQLDIKIPWEK